MLGLCEPLGGYRAPSPQTAFRNFVRLWRAFLCHGDGRAFHWSSSWPSVGSSASARCSPHCALSWCWPVPLSDFYGRLYSRVAKPKTGRRGGGKQLHATIRNELLVKACEATFGDLDRSKNFKLFPFSPQTFRRRWDEVIQTLGVQRELSITPGSVRGGGCVAAYQGGVSVENIQHVATLSTIISKMARGRRRLSIASSLDLPGYSRTNTAWSRSGPKEETADQHWRAPGIPQGRTAL